MHQMSPIFLSDFGPLGSAPRARDLLAEGASCTETGKGSAEVYGRFMGGSDQNTDNSGQFELFVHFMRIAQSRIDNGDCVCG